jgi:hypothetical protein
MRRIVFPDMQFDPLGVRIAVHVSIVATDPIGDLQEARVVWWKIIGVCPVSNHDLTITGGQGAEDRKLSGCHPSSPSCMVPLLSC